ncbi:schwannomin-interacting protein 1 [Engraulis encrasicolus]|uniref:schwannomin-interacting protein 1 n=1 Tax=Engraulis encrasicolus TaxID=184585 RepID=UPI002FD4F1C8
MEGEKERERERGEEKESDDMEDSEGASLVWQKDYAEDELGLPIMHWEDLNLRIAELEKQEEERKEKEGIEGLSNWRGQHLDIHRDDWEEREDLNSRVTALTSRFQSHMNLQLCFINDSESEEEAEDAANVQEKTSKKTGKKGAQSAATNGATSKRKSGFKMEVRAALSALRDKLWTEQSPKVLNRKKTLDRSELQILSMKELTVLHKSLTKDIQELSSDLVGRLLTRDQLRTEQDAMLLEVQDLTAC